MENSVIDKVYRISEDRIADASRASMMTSVVCMSFIPDLRF